MSLPSCSHSNSSPGYTLYLLYISFLFFFIFSPPTPVTCKLNDIQINLGPWSNYFSPFTPNTDASYTSLIPLAAGTSGIQFTFSSSGQGQLLIAYTDGTTLYKDYWRNDTTTVFSLPPLPAVGSATLGVKWVASNSGAWNITLPVLSSMLGMSTTDSTDNTGPPRECSESASTISNSKKKSWNCYLCAPDNSTSHVITLWLHTRSTWTISNITFVNCVGVAALQTNSIDVTVPISSNTSVANPCQLTFVNNAGTLNVTHTVSLMFDSGAPTFPSASINQFQIFTPSYSSYLSVPAFYGLNAPMVQPQFNNDNMVITQLQFQYNTTNISLPVAYRFFPSNSSTDFVATTDLSPLSAVLSLNIDWPTLFPVYIGAPVIESGVPTRRFAYWFYIPAARYLAYSWNSEQFGNCSASCGGGWELWNVTCVQEYVSPVWPSIVVNDSLCTQSTRPNSTFPCNTFVCPTYSWSNGTWSSCSASCGSGVETRNVTCVQDSLTPVSDSFCTQTKPETQRVCSNTPCVTYSWSSSSWGSCSVSCGSGVQTRNVTCVSSNNVTVADSFCPNATKPTSSQSCSLAACPTYSWSNGTWSVCSVSCGSGSQSREVFCVYTYQGVTLNVSDSNCTDPKPSSYQLCNSEACPTSTYSWLNGSWSSCSVSCGDGVRTRNETCVSDQWQTVNDSMCTEPKPATIESCNAGVCPTYSWSNGTWSSCSASCGSGVETRNVTCVQDSLTPVSDSFCTQTKPETQRVCSNTPCVTYSWSSSSWGSCSVSCGSGVQTRNVTCVSSNNVTVADSFCPNATKPTSSQSCSLAACPTYSWSNGTWSACSVTCGGGAQTRSVTCQDDTTSQPVDPSLCNAATKPATIQSCQNNACPIVPSSTGSASTPSSTGGAIVNDANQLITFQLSIEPSTLPINFATNFPAQVSSILVVETPRIIVLSVAAGSTIIQLLILAASSTSTVSATAAAALFTQQYNTVGSQLLTNIPTMQYAVPNSISTQTVVQCTDGTYKNNCNGSSDGFPVVIVAAAAGGGGLLLLIVIILLCRCQSKRARTKAHFSSMGSSSREMNFAGRQVSAATELELQLDTTQSKPNIDYLHVTPEAPVTNTELIRHGHSQSDDYQLNI